jgi:membrane protein implicated in regulation of membrane protease activity
MKQSLVHFFILIMILAVGVLTFLSVRPNTSLQLFVGIVTAVAYVLWGLIHHAMRKDLHQKIVVEYLLIGTIAIVLLITMLGF